MTTEFTFPKIHSFPPLYTKQPNATILSNQLDSWSQIVLQYCEYYKITSMTLHGTPKVSQLDVNLESLPSLFQNKTINRTVNSDLQTSIFNHLIHKLNKAEYINPKKPDLGIYIYWRTIVEWAQLLYDFVDKSGQLGTVLTLYELTKSEDSGVPESLRNLDEALLIKVLKEVLIKQGKAQLLMTEEGEIGGVKIV
ncbi:vacuolar protein sorting [Scheffersomyces xylosifermentans]|uniref:vacuolar protein sorting n=1 Tax=Scheffersomyces xylosifermentans TaxID=1304137 RepID=UPI00315D7DB4